VAPFLEAIASFSETAQQLQLEKQQNNPVLY
jgi:hypothetical protein